MVGLVDDRDSKARHRADQLLPCFVPLLPLPFPVPHAKLMSIPATLPALFRLQQAASAFFPTKWDPQVVIEAMSITAECGSPTSKGVNGPSH